MVAVDSGTRIGVNRPPAGISGESPVSTAIRPPAQGSEAIILQAAFPLAGLPLLVHLGPPPMRLVLARAVPLGIQLVPRVRRQDVVDVLDPVVPPDGPVHALPPHGLERVVHVGQGDPAAAVQLAQEALVGELEAGGVAVHVVDDLAEQGRGRVDDLQAAVHDAQGARAGGGAAPGALLRRLRVGVLRREGAVGRHPVPRVVRLPERVADAGVAGGEDAGAGGPAGGGGGGVVQGHGHELVHVLQDEHVAVELDDAVVLDEAEGGELGPAVVEARVVAVVPGGPGGQEVADLLVGDAPGPQGGDALRGEGVGVQSDQGVG